MESLDEKDSAVAVVGAAHVPGITTFWNKRQERLRNGGIPLEESASLHFNLQLCPGTVLPDGGEVYTKNMLR